MAGRKSTATMELAIGATIIGGIIILIVMLMAWGNSSSILGSHYRVVVTMTNVGGLKEGAPVKMGGFQIGRVASIQIRPGGTDMEIVLDIDEDRLLPRDSTAKVSTAGLVGDAFMEIIPGTSAETLTRSSTVAGADRLESSPLPDLSELLVKVSEIGDQIAILSINLNDIVGDVQFRSNVKSLINNMDGMAYQGNMLLQRSQAVVDNIEVASQNVAVLTDTLKDSVDTITTEVTKVVKDLGEAAIDIAETAKDTIATAKDTVVTVKETAELAKTTIQKATDTIDNVDGGVTEARQALAATLGNPRVAEDLAASIANMKTFTGVLASKEEILSGTLTNVNDLTGTLNAVSLHVKGIIEVIEPSLVQSTLNSLNTAMAGINESLAGLTEVVEKIKKEPVLALSINKAADRIVKMKFDEMSKQNIRSADGVLNEINRWVRESMEKGYLTDPAFTYEKRPYRLDP